METNQDHDSRATLSGVASSRIKRRAVLHAGWTVPVVLAVTAAPALAVSQPIHFTSGAGSCKLPGNSCHPATPKGYRMVLTITANQAGVLHIDDFTIDVTKPTTGLSQDTFSLSAGSQQIVFKVFSEASSQGSASMTYTFTPTGGTPGTFTTDVSFPNFPVCHDCD
jgi:hypothetical protein